MKKVVAVVVLLGTTSLSAQVSPSFHQEEHALNSGGHPGQGVHLTSPAFRMTLGAVGDAVPSPAGTSAPFVLTSGLTALFPPPGEVQNLRFSSDATILWDAGRTAGVYNLYQGPIGPSFDPAYGSCRSGGLPTTVASVPEVPPIGAGFFFLVTEENRLEEEGTKGFDSNGAPRPNPAPCP